MESTNKEICFANLFKDKYILACFLLTIVLAIFTCVILNVFVALFFIASFSIGICIPLFVFKDKKHLPDLFGLFTGPLNGYKDRQMPRSCSVCGGEKCARQHPTFSTGTSTHAQVSFTVPQSVDKALDELLNEVLDTHLYSWYHEISVHDQLADEIRFVIRYAACSLGSRLAKVDLTKFILEKLVPTLVSHLDVYVEGGRRLRGTIPLEAAVVQYLREGKALHKAVATRDAETKYLKAVVTALLPYLLPSKYLTSRLAKTFLEDLLGDFLLLQGMDLLATPDTVNHLFLLLLESRREPSLPNPTEEEPDVLFLKNFSSVNTHPRNSVLRNNLSVILSDKEMLYLFHNFLKEENAINLLQFCLSVEDFNHNILNPELTDEQLEGLHKEALELYHNYMVPTAVDRVNFPSDIVMQIREIIHSEVKDIVKLRTTRPLFQAYEHTYNLLEREYLPLFMNTAAYLSHLCGSRSPQIYHHRSSSSGSPSRSRDSDMVTRHSVGKGVVKKVGSGLKQIGKQMSLKSLVVNGDDARSYFDIDEAEDISYLLNEDNQSLSSVSGLEGFTASSFRDLTAWRVTIPRMETRVDEAGKTDLVFIVDVTRIDVARENADDLHWEVARRYHEFYILEAKLTEFHGEFSDNQLPPRRSLFSSKGPDFMQNRKEIFEEFLQKLLQKPSLKGSQLLFLFLKSKDEFTTNFLPDVSIARMIRDVPRKLIKERGQHLDNFISVFLNSTDNKPKNMLEIEEGVIPLENTKPTSSYKDEIMSTIFQNNAHSLFLPPNDCITTPHRIMSVSGVFDIILFIAVRIYSLSLNALRWGNCFRVVVGKTFDGAVAWFLRKKLTQALHPFKIVKVIKLIQELLFNEIPETKNEKEIRFRETELRKEVISLVPDWIQKILFCRDDYTDGANTLVNLFQHPVLNKQLSYVLLDVVIDELFPELMLEDSTSPFLQSLHQVS